MPRREEPDPDAEAIGRRIRQLRQEAGMGLEELAHAADVSKGHLSSLERGYVMPTVALLRKLADALGVLVADLVSDPSGSTREKILDLTRHAPSGTLRGLARDLTALTRAKIKTS